MSNNLQSIDIEHLNEISNGDENFKKELIGIFLEQIPEFVNNMNQFFGENKFEKLAREAHTAKSSVLIFGMTGTGLLLKDIQHLAENNEGTEIQPKMKQVEMELNNAKNELMILLKD
ncbi:MAG TPA: Hpt domain-containing protein [Draconibacterium sp.]|nr:Hpt domain-containing protein [Draconibacterium sp.]